MAELTGSKQSSSSPSGASYRSPTSLSSASSSSVIDTVSTSLKDAYSTAQKKAQQAISSSEDFVRERPLRTVLGAAAVGFLAGYIARRKH